MEQTNANVVSVDIGDEVVITIAPSKYAPNDMLSMTVEGHPVASAYLNSADSVIMKSALLRIGDAFDLYLSQHDEENTIEHAEPETPMECSKSWMVLIGTEEHDLFSFRDALEFARENAGKSNRPTFVYSPAKQAVVTIDHARGTQASVACPSCGETDWVDNDGEFTCNQCCLSLSSYYDNLKDAWID